MIGKTENEIMNNWDGDLSRPIVSIRCLSYNQKDFIAEALDGFLMQITSFPFEIIVHDDASTDGTKGIIEEYASKYPHIIHPIYEDENQFSQKKVFIGKINAILKGKYIANCEGDDYWIDEYKLQKQVDFMEKNEDVVMCFTNFNRWFERTNVTQKDLFTTLSNQFKTQFTLKDWILEKTFVAPMTWLVRRDVWLSYAPLRTVDGSFVFVAHFLANGKIKCLENETTAVYRCLIESASHSINSKKMYDRMRNLYETQIALARRYGLESELSALIEQSYYQESYKLILLAGPKEEREKCRNYCNSLFGRLLFALTGLKLTNFLVNALWKARLRHNERRLKV